MKSIVSAFGAAAVVIVVGGVLLLSRPIAPKPAALVGASPSAILSPMPTPTPSSSPSPSTLSDAGIPFRVIKWEAVQPGWSVVMPLNAGWYLCIPHGSVTIGVYAAPADGSFDYPHPPAATIAPQLISGCWSPGLGDGNYVLSLAAATTVPGELHVHSPGSVPPPQP